MLSVMSPSSQQCETGDQTENALRQGHDTKALVLVTGGLGYIGSHTVVELLQTGRYRVIIVDNLSNSSLSVLNRIRKLGLVNNSIGRTEEGSLLTFHQVDVRDKGGMERVFANFPDYRTGRCQIQAVLHFAGLKAVEESISQPLLYYQSNLQAAMTLLQVMSSFSVTQLIFSSTASVYGTKTIPPDGFTEEDVCELSQITNPYGKSKRMIEQILQDVAHRSNHLRVVSLRYFNPVGAHPSGLLGEDPRECHNLFPKLAQLATRKRNVQSHDINYSTFLNVYGVDYDTTDGTCIRDYIHIQDLARGHVSALEYFQKQENGGYEVFNLGSSHGMTVLEVIKTFTTVTGCNIPIQLGPRREGDVPTLIADCSKAQRILGWSPQFTLEQACADLWKWLMIKPASEDSVYNNNAS